MFKFNRGIYWKMKVTIISCVFMFLCAKCFCEDKFYEAIKGGDMKIIEEIIGKRSEIVNTKLDMRSYPLNEAAVLGRADILTLLLEKGAMKTNLDEKTGNCALLDLAKSSNSMTQTKLDDFKKCIDVFGEYKFDFNQKNKMQETALLLVSYSEQRGQGAALLAELVEYLVKKGAKFEKNDGLMNWIFTHPRSHGSKKGDYPRLELAKTLVKCGSDVNTRDDESKETPLIVLLGNKKIPDEKKEELVKLLMEHGANQWARSKDGRRPIHMVDRKSRLYEILKKTKELKTCEDE